MVGVIVPLMETATMRSRVMVCGSSMFGSDVELMTEYAYVGESAWEVNGPSP